MTTLFLVRHAAHRMKDGVLLGRLPGISLSEAGRNQAAKLAERMARRGLTRLLASPSARTLETALTIARAARVPVEIAPALDEIDFGDWTGRSFDELGGDPRWKEWNATRDTAASAGGETMAQVRARVTGLIDELREDRDGRIALVTHCDVIRTAVLHVLGVSLDRYWSIDIGPASVTTLDIGDWGAKVVALNEGVS